MRLYENETADEPGRDGHPSGNQLEVSFDTTTKKTRAHAERIERKLTGEREYSDERTESEGNELQGTHTT